MNHFTLCFVLKSVYNTLLEMREFGYGNDKKKLHGLSPRANCTDRATAACRRSDRQRLRIEGATWPAFRIPTAVFSVFLYRSRYFSIK
jgi:hypothetical protein